MTYGSLQNLMADRSISATPEVGMGATILLWSDRHACTVVDVPDDRTVVVQRDIATRTDGGMTDAQSYRYEPNPDATKETFTLRKNGKWVRKGSPMKNGTVLAIGARSEYYDFTF